LSAIPRIVRESAERWSLTVGDPFQPGGQTAWVAPVRDASGADRVLKVVWPHPEAEHEAEGLLAWDGNGAVRLDGFIEFDDATALLLERCVPGRPLSDWPDVDQDHVVAGLLHLLWLQPEAGHPFRPLRLMCEAWADEFEANTAGRHVDLDAGLVRDGIALFRSLPATGDDEVLLCTDLNAGNVLAAVREPWLVIDPKPYVGDPTYDPLQHMLNCGERLHADPRRLARRLADLCGVDCDRLLLWLFARCVQESADWPALAEVARRIPPP
jgi:streptomycin 6-kinase